MRGIRSVLLLALTLLPQACRLPSAMPILGPLDLGTAIPAARPQGDGTVPATEPEPDSGIVHAAGEVTTEIRVHYSVPILHKSLFWDGNGEDDVYGIGARAFYYLGDDFALGAGLTGDVWKTDGTDEYAGEFELAMRGYPLKIDSTGFYLETAGGYVQSTRGIPTNGTEWNFTFSFSAGMEFELTETSGLYVAGTWHHVSNALGRDHDRNPSQNEGRFTIGYGWEW